MNQKEQLDKEFEEERKLKEVLAYQKNNQLKKEDFESPAPEQVANGKCPICKVNPLNGKPECVSCWAKGKDNDKNDRIAYAQSWNLAVAICAEHFSPVESPAEGQKKRLENWQKYFYEKLTERQ